MLIVEDGTGLPDANSYASLADAARYFGLQGNDAWFGGEPTAATGSLDIASLPADGDAVVLGDAVYTFVQTLSDPPVVGEVLIGASEIDTRDHLIAAINQGAGRGQTYSENTVRNYQAQAQVGGPSSVEATAVAPGPVGNDVVTQATGLALAWEGSTLAGGSQPIDELAQEQALIAATTYVEARFGGRFAGRPLTSTQALSFPRVNIPAACGQGFVVPRRLVTAIVEYAVRALTNGPLAPDPTVDPSGYAVSRLRRKIGPIEREWEYATGSGTGQNRQPWRPYPLPDSMLSCLISGGLGAGQRRVIRS